MNRKKCEQYIERKLWEIWDYYRLYNPEGRYLSMTAGIYEDGNGNDSGNWDVEYVSANNAYFDDECIDSKRQINMPWSIRDIKDEKYWACMTREEDAEGEKYWLKWKGIKKLSDDDRARIKEDIQRYFLDATFTLEDVATVVAEMEREAADEHK